MYNLNEDITIYYCSTSNISYTLVDNKIVDYLDVVAASPVGDLIPGFNGLDKYNCKTRRETCKVFDLLRLILEI